MDASAPSAPSASSPVRVDALLREAAARIGRKRFDGVMLDTVAAGALAQLQHFDGCGTDINPDQRR